MTNEELIKLNTSILLIGFKIDSLIRALPKEHKEVYKSIIADKKELFLSTVAKHLPEDKVSEFLSMLDVD